MVDLGVCLEAIRRAVVYGRDIINFKRHPRKTGKDIGRISTEGFVEAIRAMAENCPISEDRKEYLLQRYRDLKTSPWETVAEYALSESEIISIPVNTLQEVVESLGFEPEKYEKYIPR